MFGTINGALPFTLIAWGETHIDSGVAAIANASVPIFVALLAIKFNPSERVERDASSSASCLGLVGVGVLAGRPPGRRRLGGGRDACRRARLDLVRGGRALRTACASARVPGPVLATSSMLYGGLRPAALRARSSCPDQRPGWKSIASLLALAVAGTAVAQLILFRMLRLFGAARVSLVTYLMPVTALIYGAMILDEPLRASMLAGSR